MQLEVYICISACLTTHACHVTLQIDACRPYGDDIVKRIEDKIAAWTHLPHTYGEPIEVLRVSIYHQYSLYPVHTRHGLGSLQHRRSVCGGAICTHDSWLAFISTHACTLATKFLMPPIGFQLSCHPSLAAAPLHCSSVPLGDPADAPMISQYKNGQKYDGQCVSYLPSLCLRTLAVASTCNLCICTFMYVVARLCSARDSRLQPLYATSPQYAAWRLAACLSHGIRAPLVHMCLCARHGPQRNI